MKRCLIILISFILLTGSIQSEAKIKKSGIYVDLFYGQSFIDPADLNLYSLYNSGFYNYYDNYYRANYNNDFSSAVSDGITGEFKELKKDSFFGGRLKYYFSSSTGLSGWAVSLNFKYLHGSADSNGGLVYNFDNFYSGEYAVTFETDQFKLFVEGYVPQIGIHYTVLNTKSFNFEAYFAAGAIFASCGSFDPFYYNKTEATGYVDEYEIIREYDGKGTGISLDLGARIEFDLNRSLGFFIEGGYSYQKIGKINGNALYRRTDKDINEDGYVTQYNWSGDWKIQELSLGSRHEVYHGGLDPGTLSDFTLDLSNIYLRIGFSIKIF